MALVSVVIPSRNRPLMLREAVESARAQTHPDIEIIIVLTGADAVTTQEARQIEEEFGVRIVTTRAYNLATSRNNGLAAARGEWICFLDDDDLWLPTKIEKQLDEAERSGADVVTTNWERFNECGHIDVWSPSGGLPLLFGLSLPEELMLRNLVSVGSLVRTSALVSVGGFDTRMKACEDWDCWRRLSHRYKIAYLSEVLMRVRIHATNMSKGRFLMAKSSAQHVLKMHFDTPRSLRHILPKSRRILFKDMLSAGYEIINDHTGGAARKTVRFLRGAFR